MEIRNREQCVSKIACECGRERTGETSRTLGIRMREHRQNLKEGYFDKSQLVIHAFEEGREIEWTYPSTLQFEPKSACRKYKGIVRIPRSGNPINQASLETSPLYVKKNQLDVQRTLTIFRQPLQVSGVSRTIVRMYNRVYITIGTYFT